MIYRHKTAGTSEHCLSQTCSTSSELRLALSIAMDSCSMAATLHHLEQQLSLLTGVLLTLLAAVIISFAVARCKSLQEGRNGFPPQSLKAPAMEICKGGGELVLHSKSTWSSGREYASMAHPPGELINLAASCTTTITPVQSQSTDKGELVVS